MGVWHLIFINAIQSLIITVMAVAWFIAIDTPHHDKYIIENDTNFRD
tara:strand:- start:187 stop:327 length:141 start_codon:yes stop_codon:yes gene_type:complete